MSLVGRLHETAPFEPTLDDLYEVLRYRHGDLTRTGWGPRMRMQFRYFAPDEFYEALLAKLVDCDSRWLDVGSGRKLFPSNPRLADALAARCALLVGVDPDPTILENPYVHERARVPIEEYQPGRTYSLITMRMVAEHVAYPARAVQALRRLAEPGAQLIIYTVNRWSPVSLVARVLPFRMHHAIKQKVWGGEEKDTFPVVYRMNTRKQLRQLLETGGFRERFFTYLDDCSTFAPFRRPHFFELSCRRLLRKVNLRYPENCLLGVYERV